jgi:UDP-glucuronate decarboxylase
LGLSLAIVAPLHNFIVGFPELPKKFRQCLGGRVLEIHSGSDIPRQHCQEADKSTDYPSDAHTPKTYYFIPLKYGNLPAYWRMVATKIDSMHLEKRVLITGGAGFLGSHLCERLLADGTIIVCVDNFFTGVRRNIGHLLEHKNFEVIRHDITLPLYVEVDEIYNLACPASPIHYQHDPVQTTKTSVHGAINMLGLAKRLRAKILQASTSEVYGDPSVHPQSEDYWGHVNPIGPRSCYDEGKRCAETLFFDYRRQHKLPIKVARIFNTYGPRMHPNDGRVVSNFIVQALLGRDITVFGDGLQTRSFCYVDDLIEGLIRLMNTADDVTGPMNIGNPKEFTILELANMVINLTGSRSRVVHRPRPLDDPRQRRPEISKANDLLGWAPQTALSDGLVRTMEYFEELLSDDNIRPRILDELGTTRTVSQ